LEFRLRHQLDELSGTAYSVHGWSRWVGAGHLGYYGNFGEFVKKMISLQRGGRTLIKADNPKNENRNHFPQVPHIAMQQTDGRWQ
jgi:hypothetical protein